ncbi:MAG: type IV pilus assembly protein PilM, partial [Polyangiales bacterium]
MRLRRQTQAQSPTLTGVDIGSQSIKVCAWRQDASGTRALMRLVQHPLPPDSIVDGQFMDTGAIVEGLNRLFHKQSQRDVALRLSANGVIIKQLTMPRLEAEELAAQMRWEAEQHIPFDLSAVQTDYQVLQPDLGDGKMSVLLVAAKKEELNELIQLASDAKLRPKVIDLDVFAVQNIYQQAHPAAEAQTVVLLHVGAASATLNVLRAGQTAFTRDIANGGESITAQLQRHLTVSREEAEAIKCAGDKLTELPKEVKVTLDKAADTLAGEILRSLDFYLATSGDAQVSKLVLSGGTAHLPSFRHALHQRTQLPVEVLDLQ